MIKSKKKMNKRLIALCLSTLIIVPMCVSAATNKTHQELTTIKQTAHEIANKARGLGLDNSHDIIVSAKKLWHEADNRIKNKEYKTPMNTYYSNEDVTLLAKVAFCEARGIKSKTQIACVMWTILNRHDAGYGSIKYIITAPNQFSYYSSARTVSDYGYDLKVLAKDVLERWNQEKNGFTNVGRVLPKDYLWFTGNGSRNNFRNKFRTNQYWNYSLPSPYEN